MTNLKEVSFLGVTFNLTYGKFRPQKKRKHNYLIQPSTNQAASQHNGRLSHNSSDEAVFNSRKVEYEDALKKSSYKVNLKFTTKATVTPTKIRQRNIIWLYQPFNRSVKTNVEKIFFRLLHKHFPRTNRLYKIFNHNTVKVSFSCMKNFVK